MKKTKLVTILMFMILMLLLVGCNSGEQEVTTDTVESEVKSSAEVVFPLKEKLNMTVFVNAANTGGGTYMDNYVTDWIEENTNIHLDFLYDVDGDEGKTKLNLLMTDPENLPDIFIATGWSKTETLLYGQQGLVIPLNEYLVNAENWNENNKLSPTRRGDLTMSDGNIYTFGKTNECFHCTYQHRVWIYKPWVDKLLDGKMPQTTEELYDYLVAVRDQDPNGNGLADEIPMSGYLGGWSTDPTVWLTNAFIQSTNPLSNTNPTVGGGLIVKDGKIEFQVAKDGYKEALKFMNKLYAEGLLDSQTFTQDGTQFSAALDNEDGNLIGLHPGGMWQSDSSNLWAGEDGPYQNWVPLEPVEGPGGLRIAARGTRSYFGSAIGLVSSQNKNPEIAVALFDWLSSKEASLTQSFGPKGVNWDYVDEGTSLNGGTAVYRTIPNSEKKLDADGNIDWAAYGFEKSYANQNWASDAMFTNNTADWRGAILVTDPEHDLEALLQAAAMLYDKYSPDPNSLIPNIAFSDDAAKKITEYSLTIGGYVNQATVRFITGDMDIDSGWDSYIDKLETMGLEDYLKLYQKGYDAYINNLNK